MGSPYLKGSLIRGNTFSLMNETYKVHLLSCSQMQHSRCGISLQLTVKARLRYSQLFLFKIMLPNQKRGVLKSRMPV